MTAFSLLNEVRSSEGWRALRERARNPATLMLYDRQHRLIIDAIAARDPARAETAMRSHLQTLTNALRRAHEAGHG
jgi:DNA-binding FadR family transcriptional regulator